MYTVKQATEKFSLKSVCQIPSAFIAMFSKKCSQQHKRERRRNMYDPILLLCINCNNDLQYALCINVFERNMNQQIVTMILLVLLEKYVSRYVSHCTRSLRRIWMLFFVLLLLCFSISSAMLGKNGKQITKNGFFTHSPIPHVAISHAQNHVQQITNVLFMMIIKR